MSIWTTNNKITVTGSDHTITRTTGGGDYTAYALSDPILKSAGIFVECKVPSGVGGVTMGFINPATTPTAYTSMDYSIYLDIAYGYVNSFSGIAYNGSPEGLSSSVLWRLEMDTAGNVLLKRDGVVKMFAGAPTYSNPVPAALSSYRVGFILYGSTETATFANGGAIAGGPTPLQILQSTSTILVL